MARGEGKKGDSYLGEEGRVVLLRGSKTQAWGQQWLWDTQNNPQGLRMCMVWDGNATPKWTCTQWGRLAAPQVTLALCPYGIVAALPRVHLISFCLCDLFLPLMQLKNCIKFDTPR